MERSSDERLILYFLRSAKNSAVFMAILAFAFISVGYAKENGIIFLIIGLMFFVIALWQLIKPSLIKVPGFEVDKKAAESIKTPDIKSAALDEFGIEEDDIKDAEIIMLEGYFPFPIETEPLYRYDETDLTARASNYQMSCFIIDGNVMFAYSRVKSLIDKERNEGGHVWRLSSIKSCELSEEFRLCPISSKADSKKNNMPFPTLIITGENSEVFYYSFGEADNNIAKKLQLRIGCQLKKNNRLRKPGQHKKVDSIDFKTLEKRDRQKAEIGFLGESLGEMKEKNKY